MNAWVFMIAFRPPLDGAATICRFWLVNFVRDCILAEMSVPNT